MARLNGFTKKQLIDVFSLMVTARELDLKMLILLKQGKGFFHMGCSGHEASQVAAAFTLSKGNDYSYPYYRDGAFTLALGVTARQHLLSFLARADDPGSGGRQMPMHYGNKNLKIVSQSSATGTQYLQAVGCALSRKLDKTREVVYVSSGEGTTSQGDFHEALNWAGREKAPVIFHIQDNEYAISTHKSEQTAGSVYSLVSGYENLAKFQVDGTDFFETHLAFKQAVERAKRGKGPSVIVSNVVRLMPHSSSDDQRKYRSDKALQKDLERDPILLFKKICIEKNIFSKSDAEKIEAKIKKQIENDSLWAEQQDHPKKETALNHVYSDDKVKTESKLTKISDSIVMVDAINHALHEEMESNDRMVIYGQDVADPKGGVFTATKGLSSKFGKSRVFNSQLAESSIIGTAVGMAATGYKPVVEIQFADYIWTAMMQIRNEVSVMRYRSNNDWSSSIVIRVPVGGYIHGALCHSQSIDGYFIHMPGIYIAYPSNARDAKGLLKMACRMNDPVIFMEHKGLYRQPYAATEEPGKNYVLPFGKANYITTGDCLTLICWGAMVQKSIESTDQIGIEENIVEIIDIRTLNPIDYETIGESISKTGKALVVYEDNITNGPGAELCSVIAEKYFEFLDGPVKRVASKDSPVPYNWFLEENVLVQVDDISKAINYLLEY